MSGLLPNAWLIARREYLSRVRGRTFAITTALIAVVATGVVLLPIVLEALGVDDPPQVAVFVAADDLSTDPVAALQAVLAAGELQPDAPGNGVPPPEGSPGTASVILADDPESAAASVRDGNLDGLLSIDRGAGGDLQFEFLSGVSTGSRTQLLVQQAASALAVSDRLERAGVAPEDRDRIFAPADISTVAANPADVRDEADFGPSLLVAYALVILTFMAILTYGTWVAQSAAEEKSSRVMELLITAATPRQLLAGKVAGTGAAGLTQYVVVLAAAAAAFLGSGPLGRALGVSAGAAPPLPPLTPLMVAAFILFFLGGFVLYCTLYAAIGSMVSRQEDVQQASGPLVFVAVIGYLISFAGLNDPAASWVAAAALVPFFSAYLMPARMLLADPSAIEVVVALGLLAVAILLATWVAARIYSAGVLLYGQRPGIRQVLRAARVAR